MKIIISNIVSNIKISQTSQLPSSIKLKDLFRFLESKGYFFVSQKGSHQKWRNKNTGYFTTIVVHDKRAKMDKIQLANILRQINSSPDEFISFFSKK